jgi:hypothetical protein
MPAAMRFLLDTNAVVALVNDPGCALARRGRWRSLAANRRWLGAASVAAAHFGERDRPFRPS